MDKIVPPTSQDDKSNDELLRDVLCRSTNRASVESTYLQKYGITAREYFLLHKAQNGLCAACGHPETATRRGNVIMLATDHSHRTGIVRDLLCQNCNVSFGLLDEDPERIRRLADYADKWKGL